MYKVDIEDFTEHDSSGFYYDRPVVFLETPEGGVKTISAPHMIVTLLHNLELEEGQHIVIYGAKGGYISALIAHVIGEDGRVTVLDRPLMLLSIYPTICEDILPLTVRKFLT